MERFTVIKETCFNVINSSQRREELSMWCQESAVSGYHTVKALANTLLGKLRLILDPSVLRHAFANSEYFRLFGVSVVFAIGLSWLVGGAVQVVNNFTRRKNRQPTTTDGGKVAKKQTSSSSTSKINSPTKKLKATIRSDGLTIVFAGKKFPSPHPMVIFLSGIVAVAFMAARCITRSQKKQKPTASAITRKN